MLINYDPYLYVYATVTAVKNARFAVANVANYGHFLCGIRIKTKMMGIIYNS